MANSIDGDDYEHGDARSDLSDVEILDPADDESANATSASAAEAGWVKEGPLANWEVAVSLSALAPARLLSEVDSPPSPRPRRASMCSLILFASRLRDRAARKYAFPITSS